MPKEAGSVPLTSHIDVAKYVSALSVDTVKQYLIYSLMGTMSMISARCINLLEQAQRKMNFTLSSFWIGVIDCTAACLRRINYFQKHCRNFNVPASAGMDAASCYFIPSGELPTRGSNHPTLLGGLFCLVLPSYRMVIFQSHVDVYHRVIECHWIQW